MALGAVLFDVDGTLVDTNALHVEAWQRVLTAHGFSIANDRIFVEIGKGGDNLVPDILGEQINREKGSSLRKGEPEELARLAVERGVRAFPGAVELIQAIQKKGLKVLLATSGDKKVLRSIEKASGVEWSKLVDRVVSGDQAKRSKPFPDLVATAVAKAGVSPAECAMVGDTPHDAQACVGGGVVLIGVRSGGHDDATLLRAGARIVYHDTAQILSQLDDCLFRASPGSARITQDLMEQWMDEALAAAERGMQAGEAPIGCVIARGDGKVVATAFNQRNGTQDKSSHAEMIGFRAAAGKVPLNAKDLILVSTLEPCVMCTGAAMIAGVDTIVFGLPAPTDGGSHRVNPPSSPESQMPRIIGNVYAEKSKKLFERWLATDPPAEQAAYVRTLLQSLP